MSGKVLTDLLSAGFLPNYEKSVWKPQRSLEWLGFVWNLNKGILSVPYLKMHNILKYLQLVVDNVNQLTARKVAAIVGKIIAHSPALGNICRLMTKHLHFIINERSSWDSVVHVDDFSIKELHFWLSSLKSLPNCVIAPIQRIP